MMVYVLPGCGKDEKDHEAMDPEFDEIKAKFRNVRIYKSENGWMSKTIMSLLWPELCFRINMLRECRIPFPANVSEEKDPKAWEQATKDFPYMILWMDSHASHCMDTVLLRQMRQHKVVQLNYIPHTTHICQPVDTSLMSAIKKAIAKELRYLNYVRLKFHLEPKMSDILTAIHTGVETAVQPGPTRRCFDSTYLTPGNLVSPDEYVHRLNKRNAFVGEDMRITMNVGAFAEQAREARRRAQLGEFEGDDLLAAVSVAKEHAEKTQYSDSDEMIKRAVIWQFLIEWPCWTDAKPGEQRRAVLNNAMFEGKFVPATDLRRIAHMEQISLDAQRKSRELAQAKARIAKRKVTTPRFIYLLKRLGLCKPMSVGISSAGLKRFCELNRSGFQFALQERSDALMRNAVLDQIDTFYEGFPTMTWRGEFGSRGKKIQRSIAVTREEFFAGRSNEAPALKEQSATSTLTKSMQLQGEIWGTTSTASAGGAYTNKLPNTATSTTPKSLSTLLPVPSGPSAVSPEVLSPNTTAASKVDESWGTMRLTPSQQAAFFARQARAQYEELAREGLLESDESDKEDHDIIPDEEPVQSQEAVPQQPFQFGPQAWTNDSSDEDSFDEDDPCYDPDAEEDREFAQRILRTTTVQSKEVIQKSPARQEIVSRLYEEEGSVNDPRRISRTRAPQGGEALDRPHVVKREESKDQGHEFREARTRRVSQRPKRWSPSLQVEDSDVEETVATDKSGAKKKTKRSK